MIRRILMTADTVGGVWSYSLDLAEQLISEGIQVAIATMGSPLSQDQASQVDRIPSLRILQSEYKLEWMESPWNDVKKAGSWLMSIQDAFRPDIVHLNGYCHGALPWTAPTVMVCHSCVLSWWEAVYGAPAPAIWDTYRDRVREGLQSATQVVAPTHAMLGEVERLYGPIPNSRVIPNSSDSTVLAATAKEPIIFSAGRMWDLAKNLSLLSSVAPKVKWPIYVAGDPGAACLRNVNTLGRLSRSQTISWMGRASIYALPAKYEPFGISILEAALSECALILGDIPSLRENWEECALFVNPTDADQLTDAIHRLTEDFDLRRHLGSAARENAQRFSSKAFKSRYMDAYRDALNSPSESGRVAHR